MRPIEMQNEGPPAGPGTLGAPLPPFRHLQVLVQDQRWGSPPPTTKRGATAGHTNPEGPEPHGPGPLDTFTVWRKALILEKINPKAVSLPAERTPQLSVAPMPRADCPSSWARGQHLAQTQVQGDLQGAGSCVFMWVSYLYMCFLTCVP